MIKYLSRVHTVNCKGIAILIIIICHLSALIFPTKIARLTTPLGGIGVAIFLFLSGYGINESYKEKKLNKYWKKRIINVIVPYLIIFFIYGIINYHKLDTLKLLKLFFTIEEVNNYYYWYIGYQLICYIIFFITVTLSQNKVQKNILLSLFFGICFLLFNEIRAEQSVSFMLGIIVSDNKNIKENINNTAITITLLIIGILALGLKQIDIVRHLPNVLFKFIQLAIKLSLGIALINITYKINNNKLMNNINKILNTIGKYSYEIFLSHGLAILVFESNKNNKLNLILFFIITIIVSYLLKKMTNKIKNICLERK